MIHFRTRNDVGSAQTPKGPGLNYTIFNSFSTYSGIRHIDPKRCCCIYTSCSHSVVYETHEVRKKENSIYRCMERKGEKRWRPVKIVSLRSHSPNVDIRQLLTHIINLSFALSLSFRSHDDSFVVQYLQCKQQIHIRHLTAARFTNPAQNSQTASHCLWVWKHNFTYLPLSFQIS